MKVLPLSKRDLNALSMARHLKSYDYRMWYKIEAFSESIQSFTIRFN